MSHTIEAELAALRLRSPLRRLRQMDSVQQPDISLAGKAVVNFSSNDYLGLAAESFLREAAKQAIDEFGVGTGASRLVCGTLTPHTRLEEALADFKRTQAALTFSSGYAAAVGTLGALLRRDDVLVLDKLAHASLIDGARLCGAIVRVFPHNHLGKLESHLKWARTEHSDARIIVATESVFSMDGDRSPLADIVEIKRRYDAILMLDEAHAIGVVGQNGRGLADRLGLSDQVEIQMGTLSKALGVSGGYIAGSRALIDLLINRARSFIYSTAPPPSIAVAATAAVEFLKSDAGEERRQKLWNNLRIFAESSGGTKTVSATDDKPARLGEPLMRLSAEPYHAGVLESAIIPVILGDENIALAASKWLLEKGFLVPAIRYPTVAKGTARLRITVSASHTGEQIKSLVTALASLL